MPYHVQPLPPRDVADLETRAVLKKAASAHRYLAELKGISRAMPNETILIDMLTLQEAKDSSEVENIVTTHDELYRASALEDGPASPAAREVRDYARAMKRGFDRVREHRLIRLADIVEIQETIKHTRAGLRKLPGTALTNQRTGEVVYTPPQDASEVESLMGNLVEYINVEHSPEDPLVRMAVAHFQFESIHPFYDGNGRTGRILNILFLVSRGLLDLPVLYLSRYIIRNKAAYYAGLQAVRDRGDWENWIFFMLDGVEQTSRQTVQLIQRIKTLMLEYKHRMRDELPKIYSQDLLNNMFRHPYTKIAFVESDLGVTRVTATKYLEQLVDHAFLRKEKIGRDNYYINQALCQMFVEHPETQAE